MPVIVAPGRSQAITLRPEFILPQDGDEKQHCESKAAKRWLANDLPLADDGNALRVSPDTSNQPNRNNV